MVDIRTLIGCGLLAGFAFAADAQDARDAGDTDILRGPSVETDQSPTLTERSFDGEMQVVEGHPAFLAASRLDLDAETRARIDAIANERAVVLDAIVLENLLTINNWTTALRASNRDARRQAVTEIREALAPLRALGDPEDLIADQLDAHTRSVFEKMIKDYEDSLESQARRDASDDGTRFRPFEFRIRREIQITLQEIRASYERSIASLAGELDDYLERAGLSPEGEAIVRNAIMDFTQEFGIDATREDRRRMLMGVLRELDSEDRGRAIAVFRETDR